MIGPSGFMQAPKLEKRTAWCVRCDGPQSCDERGCIVCAVLAEKRRSIVNASTKRGHARNKAAKLCITSASHGLALPDKTRCGRCADVHRRSA